MGLSVISRRIARLFGAGVDAEPAASWSTANPLERPGVKEAVEFAVHSADLLLGWLPGREAFLARKTVLEVGPGQDFGLPLILSGFGANVVLVDKYLPEWDEQFHPAYYRALCAAATERFPGINTKPIRQLLRRGAHRARGMRLIKLGLERADEIADAAVDVSYSNATLEHLAETPEAIEQLGRITRVGGLGFHQIDFRDHRDSGRPLEYLCLPEDEFVALAEGLSWSCGNRLRHTEFHELFERAGFEVRFEPNMIAEEAYLGDVRSRAQARFQTLPVEALRVLSGRFFLKKRRDVEGG